MNTRLDNAAILQFHFALTPVREEFQDWAYLTDVHPVIAEPRPKFPQGDARNKRRGNKEKIICAIVLS